MVGEDIRTVASENYAERVILSQTLERQQHELENLRTSAANFHLEKLAVVEQAQSL